ncbi:MAG: hypothetical protein ACOX3T_00720 [Bdellovibrionota bacterium]
MFLKNLFLNLLPSQCLICGRILYDKSICSHCLKTLNLETLTPKTLTPKTYEYRCKGCFKPILNSIDDYCLNCQLEDMPFRRIRYIWEYKELESIFIKKMKYGKSSTLLRLASSYLIDNYKLFFNDTLHDIVIPAFSSRKSLHDRGFLHTYFLAKTIYKFIKTKKNDVILVAYNDFPDNYDKRANLSLKARLKYSKIDVSLPIKDISQKNILFVDDMLTTGSTAFNLLSELNKKYTDNSLGIENFDILTLSVATDFYDNLKESVKIFYKKNLKNYLKTTDTIT